MKCLLVALLVVMSTFAPPALSQQDLLAKAAGKWDVSTRNGSKLYLEIMPNGRYELSGQVGGGNFRELGPAVVKDGTLQLTPENPARPRVHTVKLNGSDLLVALDIVAGRLTELTFIRSR